KLAEMATTKRTHLSSQAMDCFAFASEIALRRMLDLGHPSIDHVLCDPIAAARFDDFARSLAPGFSTLQYRWAALDLRKHAEMVRRQARMRGGRLPEASRTIALQEASLAEVQQAPAVYLLTPRRDGATPAYVGETTNLLDRARRTLRARPALDQ